MLTEKGLIENSAKQGAYLLDELTKLQSNKVKEVRGRGLMLALEFHPDTGCARTYSEALRKAGMPCKETHEPKSAHRIQVWGTVDTQTAQKAAKVA